MPLLTIYSIPRDTKCPPKKEDDLGGLVQIRRRFGYGDSGTPTIYNVEVNDNERVDIYALPPLKPGKCTWKPVDQGLDNHKQMGTKPDFFCVPYECSTASELVRPLTGRYTAKRKDQNASFPIEMSFKRNADFCLVCEILAPRAMDHAQAFLHTKPEPGNHGILHHPGDFMNQNAPLTEGYLQGTFVGPHGEKGTLRMVLALDPAANGTFHVKFGGFLSFAGSADIETTFTSDKPVAWPSQAYA